MIDLSTIKKPQTVRSKDGKTAVKYMVVAETIDLEALRQEKEALEVQLAEKEPSEKELVEYGKQNHEFYTDKEIREIRLMRINEILGE